MAEEIKVNDAAWKGLGQDDKDAIADIVAQSFGKVSIVGDAATAAPATGEAAFKFPGSGFICKALCGIAGHAGHLACGRIPLAQARAICNAAVDAGQKLCLKKC